MATTDANGFVTIENSDLFNISHFNTNAAAASAVANRVTTAEGNISDIQTALGTKVDTSTYTAGMATKVNSSTYTSGMATKVDKVDGKGLSTEDYTSAEKSKLAGIAEEANKYVLPPASSTTLGGVKLQSQVNDFIQIEESQLFREGLIISRGMLLGEDAAARITEVKLNGTTLSPTDYVVDFTVLTLGGSSLLVYRCMMDFGLVFYFEDERTITAGSTLKFTLSDLMLPGQGIVLGTSALTQNFTPFACGIYGGGDSLTVYVDKDTKLLQIAGSGLGLLHSASS